MSSPDFSDSDLPADLGEESLALQLKEMAAFLFEVQWAMRRVGSSICRLEQDYASLPTVAPSPLPPAEGLSLSERLEEVTDNFLAEFRRVQAALDDSEEQLRRLDELLMTEPGGNVAARVQDMIDQQRELQQREKRHTAEIRQLRQQIQEAEASRIDPVEFASLRSELRRVDGERTELERQLTEVRGEREDSERECSRLQGRIESLTTASDEDAVLQGVVSVIDRLLARPAKTPPEKEEPVTQSSTEAWTRRGELVLCLCVALGFFVAVFFRALSSTK